MEFLTNFFESFLNSFLSTLPRSFNLFYSEEEQQDRRNQRGLNELDEEPQLVRIRRILKIALNEIVKNLGTNASYELVDRLARSIRGEIIARTGCVALANLHIQEAERSSVARKQMVTTLLTSRQLQELKELARNAT